MMAFICDVNGVTAVGSVALPLMAGASVITGIIIALGYMLGEALQNAKIILWAKTEIFQLGVSVAFVLFVLTALNGFCAFNFASVASLFGALVEAAPGGNSDITLFEAARLYLVESGAYIKEAMQVARYHLAAYNILQLRSVWLCDENAAANVILCLFGSSIGIGAASGTSAAPESGYSFASAAMGLAFNSYIFSYLSTINYYFILQYIYSGMAFFFLPLGIFLRSMPYMRTLGSLLMAVVMAYLFVYPMTLAVFYLDLKTSRVLNPVPSPEFRQYINKEKELQDVGGAGDIAAKILTLGIWDAARGGLHDNLFPDGKSVDMEILRLSGHAFLLGVFIPTLALLMAAGSVAYLNRFLGEEIDLSRIVQMV